MVVDTYGIPTYLEANPAVITIVTFPFFFGMMFGDMGHGSIIMILGLFLMIFNDKLKNGSMSAQKIVQQKRPATIYRFK